jgi:hypothetical protein
VDFDTLTRDRFGAAANRGVFKLQAGFGRIHDISCGREGVLIAAQPMHLVRGTALLSRSGSTDDSGEPSSEALVW